MSWVGLMCGRNHASMLPRLYRVTDSSSGRDLDSANLPWDWFVSQPQQVHRLLSGTPALVQSVGKTSLFATSETQRHTPETRPLVPRWKWQKRSLHAQTDWGKGSMQESSGDYVTQTLDVIFKVVCEVRCASKNRHHRRQDVFKSEWITCSESMWPQFGLPIHAKLRDINLHNVTYSLISRNPKKWMFVVQISLLIVTFLSLVPQNFVNNVNYQRSQPTPSHCGRSIFFFCHLLTVGACVRHIAQEGQVEWITLAEWMGERTQIVLTTPLRYSIVSHATLILWYHASMLTLQELCNIMCILSRICVILRSLECRSISNYLHVYLLRRSGCKAKGVPFGSIHLNKQ